MTTLPPILDTFFAADPGADSKADGKSRDMQPASGDMDVDVEPVAEEGGANTAAAGKEAACDAAPGQAEQATPGAAVPGQQVQEGGGAKKTATRLTAEQKAVLQEAFAANPRPSVADRKQLAAQLHIESATCDRWFAAERDRQGVPKLQGRGRPPAQGAADVAPADGAPSAAAPMAPTRKRKAAYEVPTDEAGFAQLLVAVDSEVTALQAALAAPPAHWFAHLQATPAPPLGPGPQLQCAVAALMEDARLPLGEQVEAVVGALSAWTAQEGAVPAPSAGDVRSALFAVAERRRFTGNVAGDSVEGTGVEPEAAGGGGHYAWVVKDLKHLPLPARDDVTAHRARRGCAAVRLQALEGVRVALALPADMAGKASMVATAVQLLNSKDSLGDHDAAADAKRKRKEAKLAKEAAEGGAAGPSAAGGAAGPPVAEVMDLTEEGGDHGAPAGGGGAAPAAAKKPAPTAEEKAAKAAEKAAAAAEKAQKAAAKAEEAAKKAEAEAKEKAKEKKQQNMMRSLFGASPKPRTGATPSSEAAGPSSMQAAAAAGGGAPAAGGEATARRDEGHSLLASAPPAVPPCPGAVLLAMPCDDALAAMDARLLSGAGQAIGAHVTTWRAHGGGRPPLRCLTRWGTRLSVKQGSQYDPLRAGGQAGMLGMAVVDVTPGGEVRQPVKRKLLQVDTCEQRLGLGPSAMMKPPTGEGAPTPMEPLPRPAYYGTWPSDRPPRGEGLATLAKGRKPLASVAEVDYDVDSAEDWEEEEPGESVDQEEDEDAGGDTASEADDGDGFVVEDGYLSADELGEDDKALLEATCAAATVGAPPAEVEATRLRSEVEHRAKRARDANRPLIITTLSRDIGTTAAATAQQQPAGASTPPLAVPHNANVHLLNGFAIQLCDARLVIGRPPSAADRSAFGGGAGGHGAGPSGAGGAGTQAGGDAGGVASGGGASGKGRPVKPFPEDLTPALVRLMLASPGVMINKLTEAFVTGAGAARATKKATKECIGTLGAYEKGGLWQLNDHALALVGMTKQQADATRPPPPKQPRAPKAAAVAEPAAGTLRATFGAAPAAADAAPQAAAEAAAEQGGDEAEAMRE